MRMDFVFFDAGGGHRSAAEAVHAVIQARRYPWHVRLVNLQEILDPLDPMRRLTGLRIQDIYNAILRHGWTRAASHLLPLLRAAVRRFHSPAVRLLERFWQNDPPDLVMSFVPHFNQALREAFSNIVPDAPFIILLTDLADYPPHFWIENQDQHLICGTRRAYEQALALGHLPNHIFRTSGMILHPRFYEPIRVDRAAERQQIGLDPALPTGLVMFGSQGSRAMLKIAQTLDKAPLDVQLIFLCGRNKTLAARLRRHPFRIPVLIKEFTTAVPYFMRLADFFIGKPGPGSISEALAMGLPVIVEGNDKTLPQERYNNEWITENGVGLVLRDFRRVDQAVSKLLLPGSLDVLRCRVAAMNNRAVFEVPEILHQFAHQPVAVNS